MPNVPEAIDALRSALNKKDIESHVQDAFDHLASFLVLLNSSSPSVQMIQKLCAVLRKPLLPLYNACLQPALQLSSSVLSTVLGNICDARNGEDERYRSAWDETARVILSGVLDFLDQNDNGNAGSEGTIWEALCRTICEFFFLDSGRELSAFSAQLCLSAYNILAETAARQVAVRNALYEKAILGGERLGAAISKTRDYLILEALLMLFARLLPPVHNTPQGKSKRVKFVKDVLGSPKMFKCSEKLLDIIQNACSRHWDDIAALIIDVLAESDITYPQPFSIDEIAVCGEVFPQPLVTDRLIMDKQAFFANIIVGDSVICESLEVPYSRIRTITLDASEKNVPQGRILIMVYLTSPPLVGNIEMKAPDESLLYAKFFLPSDVIGKFMEALRRRGVGKLNFLSSLAKVPRKRKGISVGSALRFMSGSSPTPPLGSFESKVQRVNQVYKTDIEEPQEVPILHFGDANSLPVLCPQPALEDDDLVPASEPIESVEGTMSDVIFSSTKGTSKVLPSTCLRSPTEAIQLFGDNDRLSDISDFEPEDNMVNERMAAGVSISCTRESPTRHEVDGIRTKSSSATVVMKSLDSATKALSHFEGAVQKSPKNVKWPLTSNSPKSSSTQIDNSPMSLSNADITLTTVGPEVAGSLFVASQHLTESGGSNKSTDHCATRKDMIASSFTENLLGQHHGGRITPNVDHSRDEVTKDTSILPRISGNRRKRESIKSSREAVIDIGDESTPPRKKSRSGATCIPGASRCTKTAKRSFPGTDSPMVDFGGPPRPKPVHRGTRKSSRIKERQTAARVAARATPMLSKTRKRKQVDDQSISDLECEELTTVPRQGPILEVDRDARSTPAPHAVQTPCRSTLSPEVTCEVSSNAIAVNSNLFNPQPIVELGGGGNITPSLPRDVAKAASIRRESCQPDVTPIKAQRDPDAIQQAATQFIEDVHVKIEEIANDQFLLFDPRTAEKAITPVRETVTCSLSPKVGEALVEPFRPIAESTPPAQTITVDLTVEGSPSQKKGLCKPSAALGHSELGVQTGYRTLDPSNGIATEEPAFEPSPRRKRRTVTFASPIECTPESNFNHRSPSPSESESDILSPLMIPRGPVHARHESPDQITPQVKWRKSKTAQCLMQTQVHDQTTDEVEIQEIVEVLNEIQTVIIKGISNRFRNIKKDAQYARDELIRQVLDELQSMAVENAKYFNGLVRLEEDYYKNGKALTHFWEELIECNDGIASRFRNALTEHDQNVSAKTFPKSLLLVKPASLYNIR